MEFSILFLLNELKNFSFEKKNIKSTFYKSPSFRRRIKTFPQQKQNKYYSVRISLTINIRIQLIYDESQ